MAMRPTTIQFFVLLFVGVIVSWLWVALYGLWAIYDMPLIVAGVRSGLGMSIVRNLSLLLFAATFGVLFAALLKVAFRRNFPVASVVFAFGFLGSFVISGAFADGGLVFLASFGALWLFILFFALAVFTLSYRRHA